MTDKLTVVITDTSCFIILEKLQALHLLPQLFGNIITTPEIAAEYGNPLPDWVNIQTVTNTELQQQLAQQVDPGEASAIALAAEIDCDYLLTDDKDARKLAAKRGIAIKGSGGVLLLAKELGAIPLLKPYLEKMQQTNFRISSQLIEALLRDAGE
ncbi:DUF3368 domain-containing protein [Mucilaginibacter pedocola]|uniref:DUF3368 domain-containing protein n=1 Tax=Mucilaginibacter pedocola TaxID=1792845 RepID=A0A1S9PCY9_9SPHI|nr:DUF3368 domain-containing protein [Mucilaginibacter pedocola]OOQ58835.1 hypothetical protein BC343_09320 [Mucilaginibacter pedocola]